MLVFPPGHFQESAAPRRANRRERWLMGIGGVIAAIVIVATAFSLTTHQGKSGHGCLDFTYTMAMGGEDVHTCGSAARKLCASPPQLGGLGADFTRKLRVACTAAGLKRPDASS